jgi:hypothetical protein
MYIRYLTRVEVVVTISLCEDIRLRGIDTVVTMGRQIAQATAVDRVRTRRRYVFCAAAVKTGYD